MSLITLTFRNGPVSEYQYGLKGHNFSEDSFPFNGDSSANAHIKVVKVVQFVGTDELCVMGELTQGSISTQMCAMLGNKKAEVKELESKYGKRAISRKGTRLTLMLSGVNESDLSSVEEIEFIAPIVEEKPKATGKLIIC